MTDPAPRPRASLGRIIVTPVILMVAGYLVAGLIPGVAIAAVVGIAYVLFASRR